MQTLKRFLQSCLARLIPQVQLQHLERLVPSPEQVQALAVLGITTIVLAYRSADRAVIQHSTWATGEKDDYLPRALSDLPRDTLRITRLPDGRVEVLAGPGYQGMTTFQFQDTLSHLLVNARDAISFTAILQRSATSEGTEGAFPA
jgi:hypothetical protein